MARSAIVLVVFVVFKKLEKNTGTVSAVFDTSSKADEIAQMISITSPDQNMSFCWPKPH